MSEVTPDGEEWRPIPDWPGYEASSHGNIRSVDRVVYRSDGRKHTVRGRVLSDCIAKNPGYRHVALYRTAQAKRTIPVHTLVASAFHGPRPEGLVVRHIDGDHLNCKPSNVVYGTYSENNRDLVRHGRHRSTQRTRCPRRHLLIEPNLRACEVRQGHRSCLACDRARSWIRNNPDQDFRLAADRYYAKIMTEGRCSK